MVLNLMLLKLTPSVFLSPVSREKNPQIPGSIYSLNNLLSPISLAFVQAHNIMANQWKYGRQYVETRDLYQSLLHNHVYLIPKFLTYMTE